MRCGCYEFVTTRGDITAYSIDCTHEDMVTDESLSLYGKQLKLSLEA
jgi:hypothetical protein